MIPFARTHIRNCRPVFTLSRTSGSKKCNNVAQSTANESNKIEKINRVAIASLGVFSGCIGSMVGMGGAFVALPFLTGYFTIPHSLAHGTAITAVVATSLGGIISYAQKKTDKSDSVDKENNSLGIPKRIGHIDTLHTLCISVSSSCTVIIGAMISKRMSNRNLKLAMGGLMMLMAPSIYAKDYLSKAFTESIDPMLASAKESTAAISSSTVGSISKEVASTQEDLIREIIPPIVIGGVTGIMSGVFGIGGGAIVVPALCVFTDMEYQTALGTSLACKHY